MPAQTAVEGRHAGGLVIAAADPPGQPVHGPRRRGMDAAGIQAAGLRRGRSAQRRSGPGGGDADHAADGVRPPKGRGGATEHLDPVDVPHQQVGEIIAAPRGCGIIHPDAVHDHHGLFGLSAADVHGGGLARPAIAHHVDAGGLGEDVRHGHGLAQLQGRGVDHGDRGGHLVGGGGDAIGADDHRRHGVGHLGRSRCDHGKAGQREGAGGGDQGDEVHGWDVLEQQRHGMDGPVRRCCAKRQPRRTGAVRFWASPRRISPVSLGAPRPIEGRPCQAGLLARGSTPDPSPSQALRPSGFVTAGSPLTVAGAAQVLHLSSLGYPHR